MAQNYTKMWDAFLGGEWAGGEEAVEGEYEQQTREFYKNIIGPAFGLTEGEEGFGSTALGGSYAQFSNVDFETAERDFRMAIGDPYGGGAGDPFSWEKISRYDTSGGADSRVQQLLEDELYGQGKFLGGQTGADYGTATAKELETYTTGLTGQRESLTYEGLTGEAGIASGTGGSVLRSGESASVAEDVLIEAYKKAKTLGSEYRAGSEHIEQTLSEDLDTALTTYLAAVDEEKEDWFGDVMRNVHTFSALEMGEADPALALTDAELEAKMDEMDLEGIGSDSYENWSCGYGQKWNAAEGKCEDTTGEDGYEDEVAGYKFRTDAACGIGELWQETNADTGEGECVVRDDLDLTEDPYGYLCASDNPGLQLCGECDATTHTCGDGSVVCDPGECSEQDECGVWGGDGTSCAPTDTADITVQCPPGSLGPDGTGQATGQNIYDYSNCTPIDDPNQCDDGSSPIDGICPEDQQQDEDDTCFCVHVYTGQNTKSGQAMYGNIWDCPEDPSKDGTPCDDGGGGGSGVGDGTVEHGGGGVG